VAEGPGLQQPQHWLHYAPRPAAKEGRSAADQVIVAGRRLMRCARSAWRITAAGFAEAQ